MVQNSNQNQVEALELKLKTAYSKDQFSEMRALASEVQKLDPKNAVAAKLLERVGEKEKAAARAANAEKINRFQDDMAKAFKVAHFEEVERLSAELLKIDPGNKVVAKTKAKIAEARGELKKKQEKAQAVLKKKQEEALKPKKPSPWSRFKAYWTARAAARKAKQAAKQAAAKLQAPKPAMPAKPVAPASNVFQTLAAKVDEKKTTAAVPAAPVKPLAPAPVPAAPLPVRQAGVAVVPKPAFLTVPAIPFAPKPTVTPTPLKTEAKPQAKEPTGNVFTKMFGQKEAEKVAPSKSIIETIVNKTAKPVKPPKAEKPKDETAMGLLNFASAFFQFAVVFMLITAGFFYAQNLDQKNQIFSLFGKTNYASRLHSAAEALDERKTQEEEMNREIQKYEKGYNNRYEEFIKKVVEKRLNWPDILKKITEITDTVYERNELSQYIQYQSFSFDAEKGIVRISGTLSDPLGKNLTKLEELQQAFRTHPRDPSNPNDTTLPYFYDIQELMSLRKAFDKRTGRYTSSFQLSFALQPAAPKSKR